MLLNGERNGRLILIKCSGAVWLGCATSIADSARNDLESVKGQ